MTALVGMIPRVSLVDELLDTVNDLQDMVSLSSSTSDDSGTEELRTMDPAPEDPAPPWRSTVEGGSEPRPRSSAGELLDTWLICKGGTVGGWGQ